MKTICPDCRTQEEREKSLKLNTRYLKVKCARCGRMTPFYYKVKQ